MPPPPLRMRCVAVAVSLPLCLSDTCPGYLQEGMQAMRGDAKFMDLYSRQIGAFGLGEHTVSPPSLCACVFVLPLFLTVSLFLIPVCPAPPLSLFSLSTHP